MAKTKEERFEKVVEYDDSSISPFFIVRFTIWSFAFFFIPACFMKLLGFSGIFIFLIVMLLIFIPAIIIHFKLNRKVYWRRLK